MGHRRSLFVALFGVLVASCAHNVDREEQLLDREPRAVGPATALVEYAQVDGGAVGVVTDVDVEGSLAALATALDQFRSAVDVVVEGVEAECAAKDPVRSEPEALLTNRTFIAPADLRCSVFSDGFFQNSVILDVDLTGADLSGADLRNTRLSIIAVGADLRGADLTGADLTGSDLTGADLRGAILVGSDLGGLVARTPEFQDSPAGGLTGAGPTGAIVGCNRLAISPLVVMVEGEFRDCEGRDGTTDLELSGLALGVDLTAMSFERVHIEATNFSGAQLEDVDLGGVGVFRPETSFVGAHLAGADLSGNTFDGTLFVGADLAKASMDGSVLDKAVFAGATMTEVSLVEVRSDASNFRRADLTGASFSGANLTWDDFSGADLSDVTADDVVVVAVVCDGVLGATAGNSVRNFGLCLSSDGTWVF